MRRCRRLRHLRFSVWKAANCRLSPASNCRVSATLFRLNKVEAGEVLDDARAALLGQLGSLGCAGRGVGCFLAALRSRYKVEINKAARSRLQAAGWQRPAVCQTTKPPTGNSGRRFSFAFFWALSELTVAKFYSESMMSCERGRPRQSFFEICEATGVADRAPTGATGKCWWCIRGPRPMDSWARSPSDQQPVRIVRLPVTACTHGGKKPWLAALPMSDLRQNRNC